ncbi:PIG-L family deacetylase [Raineyella fluvialis]|uniref:GlcNAc-PI de-N-acetylase n=1 Tax=Raineyella fluvialis TaxID=2662261 RepID=A0A5Q2FA80_9ACTN|nr:PIG-L family deacetylase [Raineyella fluvialis]QGF23588.1 hypothetical protein Rai3103_07810 [Raineyella fluvialis]
MLQRRQPAPSDRSPARATRRRSLLVAGALTLLLTACGSVLGSAPRATPSAAGGCTGGSLQVVAHQDDDLFFMSPDLLHDLGIQRERCIRTVFLTAGDAGYGQDYWSARERGMEAAYAEAAKVPDTWESSSFTASGHQVLVRTLVPRRTVSLVFLRLPDGMPGGEGSDQQHHQSLPKLLDGRIPDMTAVDGSATYTAAGLRDELVALMDDARPALIRTTDFVHPIGDGDHGDHHAAAYLTRDASRRADVEHRILSYQGYPVKDKPKNVGADDLALKTAVYDTYQGFALPSEPMWRPAWLYRQYVVADTQVPAATAPASVDTSPYRPGPGE